MLDRIFDLVILVMVMYQDAKQNTIWKGQVQARACAWHTRARNDGNDGPSGKGFLCAKPQIAVQRAESL